MELADVRGRRLSSCTRCVDHNLEKYGFLFECRGEKQAKRSKSTMFSRDCASLLRQISFNNIKAIREHGDVRDGLAHEHNSSVPPTDEYLM